MERAPHSLLDAARAYTARGWRVVPIPAGQKGPRLKGWSSLRLGPDDLPHHFNGHGNIGLLLGEPSGGLVDVDLDCDEARELAARYLPDTPARSGRPGAPASHWWYVCSGATTTKHADPVTREMIVELRATGAQTLVGPSVHPSGEPYDVLCAEPARVDGAALAASVAALAEAVVVARHGAPPAPAHPAPTSRPTVRALPDEAILRRAAAYLDAMPPAISGQGGHGATYAAATALVHGFGLAPDDALRMLLDRYNPRCEPPWSERELRHKVEDAASKPHKHPFGWLREASDGSDPAVDLTGIVGASRAKQQTAHSNRDPGPLPPEALRVPGFVGEVMDHCLETAPYPNPVMAFCGALALQAFLAGRKVRDPGDNRTNLYMLGLAHSSAGKDWPRKVNTRIVHAAGMGQCLGDRLASGEGVQDALFADPVMLFQTDEIDGMLQSINRARDARHESIMNTLLTLYSSSNSVFPMRRKAGKDPPGVIDQPCLVLFGTAIPNHYYEALSERMLTNGFFARMLIFEAGQRGAGQEPSIRDLPPRVLEAARAWAAARPGAGDLAACHPAPPVVEHTDAAMRLLVDTRAQAEAEYARAEAAQDAVGTTVWGRVSEQVRKLALIHAVSEDHRAPRIDAGAVRWASALVMHQTRRMLFMAAGHVAESPFHADCLRLIGKLREAPGRRLPHSVLLKRMKLRAKDFRDLADTLAQRGDILVHVTPRAGSPVVEYELIGGEA